MNIKIRLQIFFGPIVCFLTIIVIFFSLVALHTAAKKPDRQFNCIFFRSRISERNSISFCCLRDSKLGSRQINHFLAKNKKMQLLESFLPNSIVYLILKSLSMSQKSSFCIYALLWLLTTLQTLSKR